MTTIINRLIIKRLALRRIDKLLAITLLCCAQLFAIPNAQSEGNGSRSALQSREQAVNMLRWRNRRLRELRLRFNPEAPLKESEVTQLIQTAALGLDLGQAEPLSLMIRRALNRQKVSQLISYPQLLSTFWETLSESGLNSMSFQSLRRSLSSREHTPRAYQRLFLHYLELGLQWRDRGDKRYSVKELQTFWATYLAILKRFGQVEAPIVRYSVAKHLYLLGQLSESESLLFPLKDQRGLRLRTLYLQGLIALERGELEEANKLFLSVESDLVRLSRKRSKSKDLVEKQTFEENIKIKRVITERTGLKVVELDMPDRRTSSANQKSDGKVDREGDHPYGLNDELAQLLAEVEGKRRRGSSSVRLPVIGERGDALQTLQVAFHLALARIAVLRGNYAEAWQRYRDAPPSPNRVYIQSILEAAYTLRVREKYDWCARLLDQALSQYPDSEPKVELSLWKAEMLVKSGQDELAKSLHKDLEKSLNRSLFRLNELTRVSSQGQIRFHAEIMFWLPRELSQRIERLEVDFKRQELTLKRARASIEEIKRATIEGGPYPAIELASAELVQQERKTSSFLKSLPELRAHWRREESVRLDQESQRISEDANRERRQEAARFSDQVIRESGEQLLARIRETRQELERRRRFLKTQLARVLRSIESSIARSEKRLAQLNQALDQSSKEAHKRAIETVEGLQAQLMLGPTLGYFWDKEAASAQLSATLSSQRDKFSSLNQLRQDENSSPKMDKLDLLEPIVRPLIIDPLPDRGRGLGDFRNSGLR